MHRFAPRLLTACSLAMALVMTGCSNDVAGPADSLLIGTYGATDRPDQLMATHASVELNLGCNTYFVASQAARLDASGNFGVRGRWHDGTHGLTDDTAPATLSGHLTASAPRPTVDLELRVEGVAASPMYQVTLQSGATIDSSAVPLLGCPA